MEENVLAACEHCDGACCKKLAFSMKIGKPVRDLLYAHYGRPISILRVRVNHECRHLDTVGQCGIYETRPDICREYICGAEMRPNVLHIEVDGSRFEISGEDNVRT